MAARSDLCSMRYTEPSGDNDGLNGYTEVEHRRALKRLGEDMERMDHGTLDDIFPGVCCRSGDASPLLNSEFVNSDSRHAAEVGLDPFDFFFQ